MAGKISGPSAAGTPPTLLDIYMDPSGDDAAPGTSADPIQTIFEASKRARQGAAWVRVYPNPGTYRGEDHFATYGVRTSMRTLFAAPWPIDIIGSISTVQAITITSYTDNVATVTETLTPGAHVNQFVDHLISGIPWRSTIIANTANTVTFADSVTSLGGLLNTTPPTGAHNISENAVTWDRPLTNPTQSVNGFFFGGRTTINSLDFPGVNSFDEPAMQVAWGQVGGDKGAGGGGVLRLEKCRILGGRKGVHVHGGHLNLNNTLVDMENTAGDEICVHGEQTGSINMTNTVLANSDTGVLVGASFDAQIAGSLHQYALDVQDLVKMRNGATCEFNSSMLYTTGTNGRMIDFQGDLSRMNFQSVLNMVGPGTYTDIFFADVGRKIALLKLATSVGATVTGSPNYINMDGTTLSLAAWQVLTPPVSLETTNRCIITE